MTTMLLTAMLLGGLLSTDRDVDWRLIGALAAPAAVAQTYLHESAHGAVLELGGCPVRYRWTPGDDGTGFAFSSVTPLGRPSPRVDAFSDFAPRILDAALVLGASAALRWLNLPPWARAVLWTVRSTAFVDFAFNSVGVLHEPTGVDAWAGPRRLGWSPGVTRGATLGALALLTVPMIW